MSQYPGVKRVIAQAHHRNGVGGDPFVVTLFEALDEPGTFLAISRVDSSDVPLSEFAIEQARRSGAADPVRAAKARANEQAFIDSTAVLRLEETVAGNIAFAEGNSWRGADTYGRGIAQAWVEFHTGEWHPFDHEAYYDASDDPKRLQSIVENAKEDLDRLMERANALRTAIAIAEDRLMWAEDNLKVETTEPPEETEEERWTREEEVALKRTHLLAVLDILEDEDDKAIIRKGLDRLA